MAEGKFDGHAFSRGDLMRRQKDTERRQTAQETARRLESSTIGKGGVRIKDGGGLTVEDGGETVTLYPSGRVATKWGTIVSPTDPDGQGFLVQSDDEEPILIFRAQVSNNGASQVFGGQPEGPISFVGFAAEDGVTLDVEGSAAMDLFNRSGDILLRADTTNQVWIHHTTTSATTPVAILNSSRLLQRSTSSARYKQQIEDFAVDPAEVMRLRPRAWRDRGEVADDPDAGYHVGLVAEEVDAVLPEFVSRDEEGRPDAVAYDRLTVALLDVVRDLQQQIDALAQRVSALDGATATTRVARKPRTRRPLPKPNRKQPTGGPLPDGAVRPFPVR